MITRQPAELPQVDLLKPKLGHDAWCEYIVEETPVSMSALNGLAPLKMDAFDILCSWYFATSMIATEITAARPLHALGSTASEKYPSFLSLFLHRLY